MFCVTRVRILAHVNPKVPATKRKIHRMNQEAATVRRQLKDPASRRLRPFAFCPRLLRMNVDWLRELCLSFPGTTEQIQWGNDLLFKVGDKMFAVMSLEPASMWLSFKASPENFAELTERPNIIPAPYLARAQWVALENKEALAPEELTLLLRDSYHMIVAKLPKKTRVSLSSPKGSLRKPRSKKKVRRKRTRRH